MAMALAAIAVSGCGVDKADEHSRQLDVIGDVEVATTFCTSGDVDRETHSCAVFESSHRGQVLVAYRIPLGSEAPETLTDDGGNLHFSRSDSYSAYMQEALPEEGAHWVGFVSEPRSAAGGTQAAFTVSPPLTLPDPGLPFSGPYRYYVDGGYRELSSAEDDGSAPVDCSAPTTSCFAGNGEDSLQPVRDLAVLPAPELPTVAPGGHVRVPFSLRLTGNWTDQAPLPLAASTDLAGATLELDHDTLEPHGDAERPVVADVSVPAGAAEGTYEVRLTASAVGEPDVIVYKVGPAARVAGAEERVGTMVFRVVAPRPDEPPATVPGPAPAAVPGEVQPVPAGQAVPAAPRARLALSLTAEPRRAYSGTYAGFLVEARNVSARPAMSTRVCQALPGRVQFVQASRRVAFRGRSVCFGRGRLGGGRSMFAIVYVRVDTDARAGMARASATARAANADRVGARAGLRILRRAAAPRRAPVTG